MLTVRYDDVGGVAVVDSAAEKMVNYWLDLHQAGHMDQIEIGSEVLVYQFRLAVLEDKISHTNIQFAYQDKIIAVNQYGNLVNWPAGMCDTVSKQLQRLVMGASAKRKREKEQRGETVTEVAPPVESGHE